MAVITLTQAAGARYTGTAGDDQFVLAGAVAWYSLGRVIDGLGGFDTLSFPSGVAGGSVVDADFLGVSNLEALAGPPGSGLNVTLGALASAAFPNGVLITGAVSLDASAITVPVTVMETGSSLPNFYRTGSGNDVIRTTSYYASAFAGAGDDQIVLLSQFTSPFSNSFAGGGFVDGGPGYDILIGLGTPDQFSGGVITAGAASQVAGIEEIRTNARFNLLSTVPTTLTGLDGGGARNPLVLRPDGGALNIYASEDGRASYDGRIVAYGGAGADLVRGSSVGDLLDGGAGGADSLSGEGGDDRLVFTTAAHAASSRISGGDGYDTLVLTTPGQLLNNALFSRVTAIEEIVADGRFDLTADTPTALTGVGAVGPRNPLVLRPNGGTFAGYASDDGRASYDGRIMAYGGAGADTVRGSSNGDYIEGGGGADSLSGEGGNDWLVFQNAAQAGGAARIVGGAGYDILALRDASQAVTDAAFAQAAGIEELRFLGTGTQRVTFGAQSDAAFAASSFGAGSVSAGNASGLIVDASASSRALSIYGTNRADTLTGGAGADYIDGGGRGDAIDAGAGNDHVYFASFGNFLSDAPFFGNAPTLVDGGAGRDVLLLSGSLPPGFSDLFGLAAGPLRNFEELRLSWTGDLNLALNGQQVFAGSEVGYGTVTAPNASSLTLVLSGFQIGVAVYGTAGADAITAGQGRDWLVGGAGADRFSFAPGCSVDCIADFVSGSDSIALAGFAGINSFAAVQARSTVVGGNLQIALGGGDAIILVGVTSVTAGDFVFSGGGAAAGSTDTVFWFDPSSLASAPSVELIGFTPDLTNVLVFG